AGGPTPQPRRHGEPRRSTKWSSDTVRPSAALRSAVPFQRGAPRRLAVPSRPRHPRSLRASPCGFVTPWLRSHEDGPGRRFMRWALMAPSVPLSLVVPVRDEADNLEPLQRAIARPLHAAGHADLELILVDDGSADRSGAALALLRAVLVALPLFDGMHRFLATLGEFAGARVLQLPVNHRPRVRGRTKYGVWNRLWVGLGDLMAVWWMRQRWLRYQVEEL